MKARSPGLVLALAIVGISFAGPLVKLSAADPIAIAVWRLGFSLIIVAGFLIATGEWRQWRNVSVRDGLLAIVAGVALAFHFAAWNASIHMTTIAASVVLVNLQPAVILVISAIFLREHPSYRQFIGIAIALLGALIIAAPDFLRSHDSTDLSTLGNILAISAAVTAAIYYSIGRSMRASYGVWAYVGLAYTACFVTLLILGVATRAPLYPQPPRELWIFAALAIGPMLFGHTGMNWALKFLPAYVVSLVILGEPIGATVLGMILPGIRQIPPLLTVVGGVVILIGVLITMRSTRESSTSV
ncbi:MAG TPA: DMT family transporter [Gemmatimonadaceae bacterium]|nr:DMT family transporter [Gemmatimonadaceae bacterium]